MQALAVDAKGAGDLLGLSERQVRKLAAQGELPPFRVGRAVRWRVVDLERWAERQVATGPDAA